MLEQLSKNYYPLWLKSMTKRLEFNSSQKFFVGNSLTTADFVFAGRHFGLVANPENPFGAECRKLFDANPVMKGYEANLAATFKEHFDTRPKSQF